LLSYQYMNKITAKELREFLQSEVERICIAEGLIAKNSNKITHNIEFESSKETVNESEKIEIEDVKLLAEEVKRMKELIDFRSPLLKKD
jgi:hypothetical protein